MEEASIEELREMIRKLQSSLATCTDSYSIKEVEVKVKDLTEILDFMRELKMEERSRLKYLMADLVELAQYLMDRRSEQDEQDIYWVKILRNEISITKNRMINFGANVGGKEAEEEAAEEVVVGLEEDVRKLLDRVILNTACKEHYYNIKGMIGIGKTTLAMQVYNHKDVVGRFERRGWVSFSNDMSYKEVFVELIRQMVVGSEEEELLERDSLLEKSNKRLRQMLCHHLQGKPFFIVFDNLLKGMELSYIFGGLEKPSLTVIDSLPEGMEYRYILDRLAEEEEGEPHVSRILCTSICDIKYSSPYNTHKMKPLDADDSWKLFMNTLFRGDKFTSDERKFSKELERKAKDMLKKCGGLPLAIVNVGRQKAKERVLGTKWEELFDSIDLHETVELMEPMYHNLDGELKLCFLHMSFFKENASMREEKLQQIWAARRIRTRRRIQDRCFYLAKDSIIDVVDEFPLGRDVKRCRMSPLLHMLSVQKAEEEIGLEILGNNGNSRPSQNPRHRVIHCGRDKFSHSTNQDKHLVSLIFHGGGRYLEDASPSYWESFELLNILDMEDFGVKTLSDTINTLTELRYLGLRNNYIQQIPHSIVGLKKLEVLDMALNFMVEVPDITWEMGALRDLHMSDVICRKPLKVDALQYLRTLTYISIYDWTYEVSGLKKMTKLQKLGIEEVDEDSDVGKLFASLAMFSSYFRHLILRGFRFRSMPSLDKIGVLTKLSIIKLDGHLAKLPSPENFLRRVHYLTLVNTCLDEDPMPLLEKLTGLRRLKLQNAYTGREMVIQRSWGTYVTGFLRLEALHINELWNLRKIHVEKGVMSDLEQLEIKQCPHLDTLPEEIGSMVKLIKFKMVTTKHIATKVRDSGLTSNILDVDIIP